MAIREDILEVSRFSPCWSNLALVTYAVMPEVLRELVPPGCELDLRRELAFVSLVAFDFLDTRVMGLPWPGFRQFSGDQPAILCPA